MELTLEIRVIPNAKKAAWKVDFEGNIRCYLTEQARDGKANHALIKTLSKTTGIPRSKIEIIHGTTSRNKELRLETTHSKTEIIEKLRKQ